MTDLLKLAERVEALNGPDRALDAEIDAAIHGGRPSHTFANEDSASRIRRSYGPGTVFDHSDPQTNGGHVLIGMVRHAPKYTASFEAIRSLGGLCVFASDLGADGLAMVKLVFNTSATHIIEHTGIAERLEFAWLAAALRGRRA